MFAMMMGMKGTLTFCAVACLAVWGGMRAWERYQATWPVAKAADWQMDRGNYKKAMTILSTAREQDPNDMQVTAMLAECFDRLGDKHMAGLLYREALPYIEQTKTSDAAYHRERLKMLQMLGY
jgi:Tfp pilus assembly protein PilF